MATREGRYLRGEDTANITAAMGYYNLFAALFCTSAKIDGITDRRDGLTDDYILQTLFETGSIAYHKKTGVWLPFYAQGTPNAYGRPDRLRLYSLYNGKANTTCNRDDVYIFDANALAFPVAKFIKMRAKVLSEFDVSIAQNLDVCREMAIISTTSKELSRQLQTADKNRRKGKAVEVINRQQTDGTYAELDKLSTGGEYRVGELIRDKRAYYEETLHLVGVRTPYEKGERMTNDEIETQNAEASAYIELMIKTFNQNAEEQGAPFKMVRNDYSMNAPKIEEEQGGQNE